MNVKKEILKTLGIYATADIPAEDILNPDWMRLQQYGIRPGQATAERLEAVAQLLRLTDEKDPSGIQITEPQTIAELMRERLRRNDKEKCWIVTLDTKKRIIRIHLMNEGTEKACQIDCKTITRTALFDRADSLIILHNHPSGDTNPSATDIKTTKNLKKALNAFEISLCDHIILAKETFYSFAGEATYTYENRTPA